MNICLASTKTRNETFIIIKKKYVIHYLILLVPPNSKELKLQMIRKYSVTLKLNMITKTLLEKICDPIKEMAVPVIENRRSEYSSQRNSNPFLLFAFIY